MPTLLIVNCISMECMEDEKKTVKGKEESHVDGSDARRVWTTNHSITSRKLAAQQTEKPLSQTS